jgi:hypothetical protein
MKSTKTIFLHISLAATSKILMLRPTYEWFRTYVFASLFKRERRKKTYKKTNFYYPDVWTATALIRTGQASTWVFSSASNAPASIATSAHTSAGSVH